MRAPLLTILGTTLLTAAAILPGRPAMAAAMPDSANAQLADRLNELVLTVTAGDDPALLNQLRNAAADPALLPLERDQLLLALIDSLRNMSPGAVGPDVFTYLSEYRPQALMPDEERPAIPVPVYNIRAAAAGLRNTWRRREAAYAGAILLDQDPAALVQSYGLHDDLTVRRGLLAALDGATEGQLEMVSFLALSGLQQEPALSVLAGEAALRIGDTRALEQLVRTGSGSAMTHVLREAGRRLSPGQAERLLDTAVKHAQPEVAAVAIAELAPLLRGRAGAEDRLFKLLGSQQLGSSAALALAANPSDATVLRLGALARNGDLASRRAQMALEMMAENVDEAGRP